MPESIAFVHAFMAHIMEQTMVPKLQVERIVGPILGMFLPEVLSVVLTDKVKMISSEFPLRKGPETLQSTNIDWLLYAGERQELLFVELKTTDTTYNPIQHQVYREVINRIRKDGPSFLAADVEAITPGSRERGKYRKLLSKIPSSDQRFRDCRNGRVVYLAPREMKETCAGHDSESMWLSFHDLPADGINSFAEEWSVVLGYLLQLDNQTRRSRNSLATMPRAGGLTATA